MATTPIKPSRKLTIIKIVFNVTVFLSILAIFLGVSYYSEAKLGDILEANGVSDFADLSANLQAIYGGFEKYVWHTKLNPAVMLPIAFVGFSAAMVFKDQLKLYYKIPKGVGVAIAVLIISFIIEYIAMYAKVSAGAYLLVTLVNSLYLDPAIIRAKKIEDGE